MSSKDTIFVITPPIRGRTNEFPRKYHSSLPRIWPNVVKLVVVPIGKMPPHIIVSLEAPVIFPSGFTMEAIPNMSMTVWYSQTIRSNYER